MRIWIPMPRNLSRDRVWRQENCLGIWETADTVRRGPVEGSMCISTLESIWRRRRASELSVNPYWLLRYLEEKESGQAKE